jgi:hypothetical protein
MFEGLARLVLHIVADVVNHFNRPSEQFPIRRQIESRFHDVLSKLLALDRPTRMTVIAHSQGSVIVFNALADLSTQKDFIEMSKEIRIDVVTVGSPLTHIYQHYFPTDYLPCDDPKWTALRKTIASWRNVYRVDDYVGTYIMSDALHKQRQDWPQNIPAEPGGHTSYWEQDIFRHLEDVLPGESRI